MTEILPGLWIDASDTNQLVNDISFLNLKQIQMVINCSKDIYVPSGGQCLPSGGCQVPSRTMPQQNLQNESSKGYRAPPNGMQFSRNMVP